jgi:para-nitrobenzyl esterase
LRLFSSLLSRCSANFIILTVTICTAMSAGVAQTDVSAAVVSIRSGQIRGTVLPSGRAEFLGIPFAQPPVGDLRWHAPLPPKPWNGMRDVKKFGAPCAQNPTGDWNKHDAEISSEDCLFLNVMTPQWPVKKPLPVMFWIHGGANTGGTASSELYKDGTLVQHGVVLVTANYRLSVFGFLAHPELTKEAEHHSSGNYAILDQIAALQWVHDNIAKFGGDPGNVTVFGQSAGAIDMGLLMTSPLARPLFHKGIGESGTVLIGGVTAATLSWSEQGGVTFATKLHAPETGQIKYLRGLSAAELLAAARQSDQSQIPGPPDYRPWANVDGWVFPQSPAEVFATGKESPIPLITGNNTREFDIQAPLDQLKAWIQGVYGDLAPKAFEAYGLANGAQGNADPLYGTTSGQWSADVMFRCPATAVAAWHSAAHHPTYEYQLERAIPGQEAKGSIHSADLPYVFGFFPKSGNISGPFSEVDYKLADLIEKYWTTFARTGDPNGDGLPNWPEFDNKQAYVSFTAAGEVSAHAKLREPLCQIYRESLKQHLAK